MSATFVFILHLHVVVILLMNKDKHTKNTLIPEEVFTLNKNNKKGVTTSWRERKWTWERNIEKFNGHRIMRIWEMFNKFQASCQISFFESIIERNFYYVFIHGMVCVQSFEDFYWRIKKILVKRILFFLDLNTYFRHSLDFR